MSDTESIIREFESERRFHSDMAYRSKGPHGHTSESLKHHEAIDALDKAISIVKKHALPKSLNGWATGGADIDSLKCRIEGLEEDISIRDTKISELEAQVKVATCIPEPYGVMGDEDPDSDTFGWWVVVMGCFSCRTGPFDSASEAASVSEKFNEPYRKNIDGQIAAAVQTAETKYGERIIAYMRRMARDYQSEAQDRVNFGASGADEMLVSAKAWSNVADRVENDFHEGIIDSIADRQKAKDLVAKVFSNARPVKESLQILEANGREEA